METENPDENYVITLLKIELSDSAIKEGKKTGKSKKNYLKKAQQRLQQNLLREPGQKFMMEKILEFLWP